MVMIPKTAANIVPGQKPKYELLPRGDYPMVIEHSEDRALKQGPALHLTLRVLDGPYDKRKMWDDLRFDESNRWGLERTLQVFAALGIPWVAGEEFDGAGMVGRMVYVKVTQKDDVKGGLKNVVEYNGYAPLVQADANASEAGDVVPEEKLPF